MTRGKKIARRYIFITVGAISLVSLIFYFIIVFFPGIRLPYRIGLAVVFLLANGLLVYGVARGYARAMTAWIDSAYQSEKSFIGNASHELNNPLTAIQGECEISLMKERSASEYQSSLTRIASEANRIILLMKHLMFLSKGEEELLKTATQTIILAEFMMQFMERRIRFAPDNFAFMIDINPHLLKMALSNIIGNALKYSADKTVEIRLRGSVLEVKDQGIGIPAGELERVFQPFYRATNTREYQGNGIGLSLSLRILRAYGAEVTIWSALNEGTRVKIDFQRVR
ncbi:MAG: HAMP domain-containing histidine kinase [Tannerellaceae bacterium]|jgi:signal transduction histidine kinase|nr:HAMP domain-containing histidine kinase [Tannerellaceae bacterium]